jgi:acyl carrier protein
MPTTSAWELGLALTEAVAKEAGLSIEQVIPETELAGHEIDDTALAMIALELEARFEIEIPEDLFCGSITVKEMAERLCYLVGARGLPFEPLGGGGLRNSARSSWHAL